MDWEQLEEKTLGQAASLLVAEGAGTATGFIGGAALGRQIQNLVKKDEEIVNATDKVLAWSANNVPKLAVWWMARGLKPGGEVLNTAIDDGRKAFAGSVVFDTLMRLSNGGKNPATASIFGYQILGKEAKESGGNDVQRVLQENSALRGELNKALQRLAAQPTAPRVTMTPQTIAPYIDVYPKGTNVVQPMNQEVAERQRRFGAMQQTPPIVQEREKKYGFMQPVPPAVQERERKFGFAGESANSAAGSNGETMAKMSGFL